MAKAIRFPDGHYREGVEFDFDEGTRRVSWMSDWTRCDEMVELGYLRRVNHGPSTYGHCDYYLNELTGGMA